MKYVIIFVVLLAMVSLTIVSMDKQEIIPGPEEAALDGILAILTAAGGTYALKRLREEERNENDKELS